MTDTVHAAGVCVSYVASGMRRIEGSVHIRRLVVVNVVSWLTKHTSKLVRIWR